MSGQKYLCGFAAIGQALEPLEVKKYSSKLPLFISKTVLLSAGEVWTFTEDLLRPSLVEIVSTFGLCLLHRVNFGHLVVYRNEESKGSLACFNARACSVGERLKIEVACEPSYFGVLP